jgi:8-oxo-dGTP pyrophosphatase MutT (NUDIX family)
MQADSENLWIRFPKQAVYGIVFDAGKCSVLMVKRRDIPVWVLPGGGLDRHETPEQGAVREVLEETGFQVVIVRKIAEYLPVNKMTQYTHLFECRIVSGAAKTGAETKEVGYYPLDRLKKLPPPFEGWVLDALANHPYTLKKNTEGVTWWKFFTLLLRHPVLVIRFVLARLGIHFNSSD